VGAQLADVVEGIAELRDLVAGGTAGPPETPADRLETLVDARINETGL